MNNSFTSYILSKNGFYRIAFYFSVVVLSLLLALRIALIFSYVPEITGIDNDFVHTVTRMLAGFSPYPEPGSFPYSGCLYSPLYYNICDIFGKILGVNPEYPIQVYRLCRGVALFFDIASVYFLYLILVNNIHVYRPFAYLGIAFFSCILCYLAYTFSRVDCVFLAFYASVFYFLTKPKPPNQLTYLFLLPILSVSCVFAKQNGIILPILVSAWLFFSEEKRKIVPYIAAFILFFIAYFFIYSKLMGYTHLTTYTIKGIQNRIDPQWFYVNIFKPLANSILILPLCAGFLISTGLLLSRRNNNSRAYSIAFLLQIVFSTGTAFKWGSSLGYYNECFFLSLILIAKFGGIQNLDVQLQNRLFWFSTLLLSIFFAHVLLQDYLFFINQYKQRKEEYYQQSLVKNYLKEKVKGQHIFNLYNPNRDFFKNFFYREIVAPHFDTVDCCLLPDGTFDYTQLKNEFKTGTIKFIIFPKDKPLKTIWNIPLTNYEKDTTIFDYDIYQFHSINRQ